MTHRLDAVATDASMFTRLDGSHAEDTEHTQNPVLWTRPAEPVAAVGTMVDMTPVMGQPVQESHVMMGLPVNQFGHAQGGQVFHDLGAPHHEQHDHTTLLAKSSFRCFWIGIVVGMLGCFDLTLSLANSSGSELTSGEQTLNFFNTFCLIAMGAAGIYAGKKKDMLSARLFMMFVGLYLIMATIIWIESMIFLERWDCVAEVQEEVTCDDNNDEGTCNENSPFCYWEGSLCVDQSEEVCEAYIKLQHVFLFGVFACTLCYVGCCFNTARDHSQAVASEYRNRRMFEEAAALDATRPEDIVAEGNIQ